MDDRRTTAIHEAGHAVVAEALNVPLVSVTIVPEGDAAGSVIFARRWLMTERFERDDAEAHHMAILMAGFVAVNLAGQGIGYDDESVESDLREADIVAFGNFTDPVSARVAAEEAARIILVDRWAQVERLADELIAKGTIEIE